MQDALSFKNERYSGCAGLVSIVRIAQWRFSDVLSTWGVLKNTGPLGPQGYPKGPRTQIIRL